MNASESSQQTQPLELSKAHFPLCDMLKEDNSLSRTESKDESKPMRAIYNTQNNDADSAAKLDHALEQSNHGFFSKSKQSRRSDDTRKQQRDKHTFASVMGHAKHSRYQQSLMKFRSRTANISTSSRLPVFVKRPLYHCKQTSNRRNPLFSRTSGHSFGSRLPVPCLTARVFESSIPPPDFDIVGLWEEVQKHTAFTEQICSDLFENMALEYEPKATQGKRVFSSKISTILKVEHVAGRPQFASDVYSNREEAESNEDFPPIDHINRIVSGMEAANDPLRIEEESRAGTLDSKRLNHVCPNLRHLRFQDPFETVDSVEKRVFGLNVIDTFGQLNYPDVIESSVILGPNSIGASFLCILKLPATGTRTHIPYWEPDALTMLVMRLRMHHSGLDVVQKRAFVENLHHFCYEIVQDRVIVWMMSIKVCDLRPPASSNSALNTVVIPTTKKPSHKSEEQPTKVPKKWQRKAVPVPSRDQPWLQRSAKKPGLKNRLSDSKVRSMSATSHPQAAANHTSSIMPSTAPNEEATSDLYIDLLPCYYQHMGHFDLDTPEGQASFFKLNTAVMKWGQAIFDLTLAKEIHELRA